MLLEPYWETFLQETYDNRYQQNLTEYTQKFYRLDDLQTLQAQWREEREPQQKAQLAEQLKALADELDTAENLVLSDTPISDALYNRLLNDLGYKEKDWMRGLTRTALKTPLNSVTGRRCPTREGTAGAHARACNPRGLHLRIPDHCDVPFIGAGLTGLQHRLHIVARHFEMQGARLAVDEHRRQQQVRAAAVQPQRTALDRLALGVDDAVGHGHADLQRHRAPRPGVTDPAGVVCRLDVLAFHADPEARGGIEVEGLVPEQPRRFAPGSTSLASHPGAATRRAHRPAGSRP